MLISEWYTGEERVLRFTHDARTFWEIFGYLADADIFWTGQRARAFEADESDDEDPDET